MQNVKNMEVKTRDKNTSGKNLIRQMKQNKEMKNTKSIRSYF